MQTARTQSVNSIVDRVRLDPAVRVDLRTAAAAAGYGPHHFHRLFASTTGETLQAFSSRVRLASAARLLRSGWSGTLLELALVCGFGSATDFSRRFRDRFECTPRDAQRGARVCVNGERLLRRGRIEQLKKLSTHAFARDIRIEEQPAMDIVYGRVFGAMENHHAAKQMLEDLFAWAVTHRQIDMDRPVQVVGLAWDDVDASPLSRFSYDAGIVVRSGVKPPLRAWMNRLRIPRRQYTVMDFEGDLADEEDAFDLLHHSWLARNGCLPAFGPTLEVFSNERSLHDWDHLKLKLMVPVTRSPWMTRRG